MRLDYTRVKNRYSIVNQNPYSFLFFKPQLAGRCTRFVPIKEKDFLAYSILILGSLK